MERRGGSCRQRHRRGLFHLFLQPLRATHTAVREAEAYRTPKIKGTSFEAVIRSTDGGAGCTYEYCS